MPELSRRAMLRLGILTATGAATAYAVGTALRDPSPSVADPSTAGGAPLSPSKPLQPASAPAPTYLTGSFVSAARGGVPTEWVIARPPGQTAPLRPVILLHGKDAHATGLMALGVEQFLADDAVGAGVAPFAIAAADGGNSYWHKRASGEDSGAMVLDEFIPMLETQGLDTSRVAFMGWSMGAYGAMLLGSRLGPGRTAAICAVSPALWTSSGAAAPGAFDGPDDYAANNVWGLPELNSIPLRIDCGTDDSFYDETQQFIAQLPNPPAGGFSPGGHNVPYWSSQLTSELSWIAPLLVA